MTSKQCFEVRQGCGFAGKYQLWSRRVTKEAAFQDRDLLKVVRIPTEVVEVSCKKGTGR